MNPDRQEIREYLDQLKGWTGSELTFMEVCGTHTVSAARAGLRSLLPPSIRLISGPGCPVCVTPVAFVDHALALSSREGVTIATFGDLVNVPGSFRPTKASGSAGQGAGTTAAHLAAAKARGADVRVVYSPLDALDLARRLVQRQVVFLSVGFETTTPAIAAAVQQAAAEGLGNFSVLAANKAIVPALLVLGTSGEIRVDGFLCPGHVSVIIGAEAYRPLADRHGLGCAIAGFEPVEMLRGMAALLQQVVRGEPRVDNCYPGAVRPQGNAKARRVMERVFEPCDSNWRGMGTIPQSGLTLRAQYRAYDAAQRFRVELAAPVEPPGCRCGDVLRGVLSPPQCGLFGSSCTPDDPKGACMVSSEGSCAAHYHYGPEARGHTGMEG